ncbi:MAG: hypothetical protein V3U75_13740 [Methylococcaceae bacterium]
MRYQFHLLPIGFDALSFQQLETQINGFELGVKLEKSINSDVTQSINASIIDFDSGFLDEKLDTCSELLPDQPIIGLFKSPIELENVLTLKKPLRCGDLRLTLDKLSGKRVVVDQKPIAIRAIYSNPESPLHYPIKNCFQSYLVQVWKVYKKVNRPIKIIFLNKPVLVFYQDKVSVLLSTKRLKQLCQLTIHDHSISISWLLTPPPEIQSINIIYFIAQIALWSSQGRLADGVNSTDIVRLVESEIDYLLPKVEESELILNLWRAKDCSLLEAEQVLQVRQSNLFSYFSMLYALGLVEVLPPNQPSIKQSKGEKKLSKWEWLEKKLILHKNTPTLDSLLT